ncbi:MAG: hypothetical protein Q9166_000515 [cf. Caloplaca sp. 2 TL-2023]
MNPRAYSLSTATLQHSQRKSRDAASTPAEPAGMRHPDLKSTIKPNPKPRPPKMTAISPAAPSKPVVIPTRTKTDRRHTKAHARGERIAEETNTPHDTGAVPPSVAALFAITSLRDSMRKTGESHRVKSRQLRIDDELIKVGNGEYSGAASSAASPHSWRVLLSPPQDMDDENLSLGSDVTTLGPLSSFRSLSSDSMPSLETDTESTYASSSPSTPGFFSNGHETRERKSKSISSSVAEDSNSNHPLLVVYPEQDRVSDSESAESETKEMRLISPTRPSLKSNLTASFRRLKSAAKTITSLGATTASQEEVPNHATLSGTSRFADERRPLPWAEPPDPALRRYLNPITISPAELYTHRGREEGRPSSSGCTASIQMQTYQPGARKSAKATAPPVFLAASPNGPPGNEPAVSAFPRNREPRENSDFLRVMVLEMNMRKTGKLSDAAPGRAKLWLPARQASTQSNKADDDIPRRWMAVKP